MISVMQFYKTTKQGLGQRSEKSKPSAPPELVSPTGLDRKKKNFFSGGLEEFLTVIGMDHSCSESLSTQGFPEIRGDFPQIFPEYFKSTI